MLHVHQLAGTDFLFWRLDCYMLMYCEVFVVHFLWRSQHEQLWKDYREYTLKDISSATRHYFSQVLLLLSKFCEFLFGGESPTFWPCHAPSFPPLFWVNPKDKQPMLLRNCGASWWPSAFRSRSDCSGTCYTMRRYYLNWIIFLHCFFYTVQVLYFSPLVFPLLMFLLLLLQISDYVFNTYHRVPIWFCWSI